MTDGPNGYKVCDTRVEATNVIQCLFGKKTPSHTNGPPVSQTNVVNR